MGKRFSLDDFLNEHSNLSMQDMYDNQGDDLAEVLSSSIGNIYTVYRDPKDHGRLIVMQGLRFTDTTGFFLIEPDQEEQDGDRN